jgi:hypothetical protein
VKAYKKVCSKRVERLQAKIKAQRTAAERCKK